MFETTPIHPHMAASVEVPYDLRFAGLVLDWATGIVELSGGDRRETDGLRLALEETLAFLISAYDEAESWELIRVQGQLSQEGVAEFSITNAGPPVHLDQIPDYDPDNIHATDADGLWYFLAQKMVDSLEFHNRGMEGWQVVIKQRLAAPNFETDTPAEEATEGTKAKVKFTSRLGTPDDASQLMDLTYDTYRYSYPGEEYYHESKLRAALAADNYAALMVENGDDIIGYTAISVSDNTPRCGYLGTLMVGRAYRHTRAIAVIIRDTAKFLEANQLGVDLYYGTMVTEHPASQKAGTKVGMHPLALLLSVGAAVDYRGMQLATARRESFALCARLSREPELSALHLPERHHGVMQPLLHKLGYAPRLQWNGDWEPAQDTTFSVNEDHTELNGYITCQSMGQDWHDRLRRTMFDLTSRGLRTSVILIPAWKQPPADLDERMAGLNAIFTGIKPVSGSEFLLVYCAVTDHVDFDHIRLADPNAEALKEHIRQLYCETLEG